ncbi:MAG: hypothetical protein HXY22_07770 [Alphaproteobacteria bacterium]|nr:hypothetical protein [Alphaproteobacteria bacterium]
MSEFDVKVSGAPPRRKHQGPLTHLRQRIGHALRAGLMRPRAVVLGGLAAFVLVAGTPHVGWDYECSHAMRGPGSCRAVAWCAYYGLQGRRIDVPKNGESCALVTVLPLDFAKLLGG